MRQNPMAKLMGYDFLVEYKRGKDNRVADALSRKGEDDNKIEVSLAVISLPTLQLREKLTQLYKSDTKVQEILKEIEEGKLNSNYQIGMG